MQTRVEGHRPARGGGGGHAIDQDVLTLALALLSILAGSVFILYGSAPLRDGLPPALGGALLLALGTTLPELAITVYAALSSRAPGAIDNYRTLTGVTFPVAVILGSCFANLFLAAGFAGLLQKKPYRLGSFLYARDLPALFLAIALAAGLSWWLGTASAMDEADKIWIGYGFIGLALLYALVILATGAKAVRESGGDAGPASHPDAIAAVFAAVMGLVALGLGSVVLSLETPGVVEFFSHASVDPQAFPIRVEDKTLYMKFGLLFIGAALALPEIVATLFASLRREPGAVAGNLVSATVFNLLGVLGLGIVLSKGHMLDGLEWSFYNADLGVLLIGAGLLSYGLHSNRQLSSTEGLLLIVLYGGYWGARFAGVLPL